MPVRSAALLLYRRRAAVEVWIAHMGGPFWARKDEGAWSLPKGIVESDDLGDELAAARREFAEEMGSPAPDADYVPLGEFRGSGKTIVVFAAESEFEPDAIDSNTFELEWPPQSGRMQEFPEIDDARWFSVEDARLKLTKAQRPILDALLGRLEEDAEIH
ncbi:MULTISPECIES: NUDIX domain-containing protein [unclassified Leifsonia]|uniref:NUDIX domain-containing protein n=1 Tax=unclassified Leifsonia TaxID=2663824 RepID=UPI00036A4EF5|nr:MULTISPECIES: NUDIX domain-containing protein [unclassified Leifsonia]TDQ03768.1 putative NUDIX family NTP pyrophosphohydrolase [Leifsonia sp. 115AMFTsu3.1]